MNENRRRVLEMTAQGKLSAEEAERLLSALDEGRAPDSGGVAPVPPGDAKYLRIVVEPGPEVGPEGEHVNIRVPARAVPRRHQIVGAVAGGDG